VEQFGTAFFKHDAKGIHLIVRRPNITAIIPKLDYDLC
jgi:hypothetical protein